MNATTTLLSLFALVSASATFGCDGEDGTAPGAPNTTSGSAAEPGAMTDVTENDAPGAMVDPDATPTGTEPTTDVPSEAATPSLFATGGLGEDSVAGWEGYLFTTTEEPNLGTTIVPEEGEAFVGSDLCVSGSVAADEDYGGFAMLGWNISQTINEETFEGEEANEIEVTGTGITYNIVNNNPSTSLRIQLQDNSESDEGRWCADVTSTSGTILWKDFNTTCWNGLGDDFSAGTSISSIAIQVAGAAADDVIFDFCLVDLKQAP